MQAGALIGASRGSMSRSECLACKLGMGNSRSGATGAEASSFICGDGRRKRNGARFLHPVFKKKLRPKEPAIYFIYVFIFYFLLFF